MIALRWVLFLAVLLGTGVVLGAVVSNVVYKATGNDLLRYTAAGITGVVVAGIAIRVWGFPGDDR